MENVGERGVLERGRVGGGWGDWGEGGSWG